VVGLLLAVVVAPRPELASALFAQQAPAAAESYLDRYAEVMALDAAPDGVADVSNLEIRRDAARFTLTSGKLYLLKPRWRTSGGASAWTTRPTTTAG
jgi:hypothetical protein